jgi:hypothetical protein
MTERRHNRRTFVKQVGGLVGATALWHPAHGSQGGAERPTTDLPPGGRFPTLNANARGWLRFLWQKTTTPDDWSRRGRPHPWWDVYSAPGVQSHGRFDLSDVGEPGAWTRAFSAPHLDKFGSPTVEGIDYPSLGVAQAWNDPAGGMLHVVTYPASPDNRYFQIMTSFRRVGRREPAQPSVERVRPAVAAGSLHNPDAIRRAGGDLLAGSGPTCPCCVPGGVARPERPG